MDIHINIIIISISFKVGVQWSATRVFYIKPGDSACQVHVTPPKFRLRVYKSLIVRLHLRTVLGQARALLTTVPGNRARR